MFALNYEISNFCKAHDDTLPRRWFHRLPLRLLVQAYCQHVQPHRTSTLR